MKLNQAKAAKQPIAAQLAAGRAAAGAAGAADPSAQTAMPAATAALRAEYENSPEYRLGCEIIDALTESLGLGADEVAAMLSSNSRPAGFDMLSMQAAKTLEGMEKSGRLRRSLEEYLADEGFIKLLREVPAQVAVRLSDAEHSAKKADERVGAERNLGMQDVLEKLKARRALPAQARAGVAASAKPDFSGMSSEEFNAFRRRYFSSR